MTDDARIQIQRETVARIKATARTYRRPVERPLVKPPTTLARVAARYAHLWRVSLAAAAREFGVRPASAHDAWRRIYPGQSALLSLRSDRRKPSRRAP